VWLNDKKGKEMKYFLLFFLLLSQTSCANIKFKKKHKGINPIFKPYIQEFVYASMGKVKQKDLKGLTMGFHKYPKNSNTVGTCHPMGYFTEIDINKKWWDNHESSTERQELIFHELGHCILKRGHTEEPINSSGFFAWWERLFFKLGIFKKKNRLPDGCPSSYMHPYTLSPDCIMKHYLYYLDELFTEIAYEKFSVKIPIKSYIMTSCRKPKIINKTKTWTDRDMRTLARAKNTCKKIYKSCLKTFTKVKKQMYRAMCEG